MYDYETGGLQQIIGSNVRRIAMNNENLVFDTDKGVFAFYVEGDCCSYSYFHDFVGVAKLIDNGSVVSVETVELEEDEDVDGYETQAYGFRIITVNLFWGEQSSVFSFRNESNGYYGGWMNPFSIDDYDWEPFFEKHQIHEDTTLD